VKLCICIREKQEGVFLATCPDLPGCKSCGHSPQEARDKIDEAIRGYMAAMNNFVPENLHHEVVEPSNSLKV